MARQVPNSIDELIVQDGFLMIVHSPARFLWWNSPLSTMD